MGVKSKGHRLGLCADIFLFSRICYIILVWYLNIYCRRYALWLVMKVVFLYTHCNMFFVVSSVFYGEWPIFQICGSDSIHLLHFLFLKLKILRKKNYNGIIYNEGSFHKALYFGSNNQIYEVCNLLIISPLVKKNGLFFLSFFEFLHASFWLLLHIFKP